MDSERRKKRKKTAFDYSNADDSYEIVNRSRNTSELAKMPATVLDHDYLPLFIRKFYSDLLSINSGNYFGRKQRGQLVSSFKKYLIRGFNYREAIF